MSSNSARPQSIARGVFWGLFLFFIVLPIVAGLVWLVFVWGASSRVSPDAPAIAEAKEREELLKREKEAIGFANSALDPYSKKYSAMIATPYADGWQVTGICVRGGKEELFDVKFHLEETKTKANISRRYTPYYLKIGKEVLLNEES